MWTILRVVKTDWSDSESDDSVDDSDSENDNDDGNDDGDFIKREHDRLMKDAAQSELKNVNGEILDPVNPSSSMKDEQDEVFDSGRLFVRNLPYTTTAIDGLDNSTFQGRLLHVMPARHKNSSQKQETGISTSQGSKTLKQRREEERKAAEASGDTKAWNSELAKMFGKFGSLDKVILPTTRTLALVVFLEPAEASAAFKGLAYKRYKGVPLYLEWAPSNILNQNSTSESGGNNNLAVGEHDAKRVILEQRLEGISDVDIDPDRVEICPYYQFFSCIFVPISLLAPSRSLFVKNLNFKTSDENLRKHFSEHMKEGSIISVRVKKHLKNGKNVSMGFGFIEFDSMETAGYVCKDLQGTILDGHALIVQLCHAKKDEQVVKKVGKDKSSTKLLVKNVAFEATEKDLRQLFSSFGQIKSLRLPMKFGNHRGFAFVEFVTKQEAQNALEALSNTHLYGRHLVLERAKEGESLEELRARTAAQFSEEQTGFQNSNKLSKKRKHMAILDEGTMKFERIADC
ncbi:hypothetical protein LWI29_006021 [Acer saccharum]|uniref:RRM domain-containing protein n=1 Tax=Acer saccharum TaxID=4024 RepID=A0AA39SJY4_ACESA|nr:hypothetical protein LWI29_006021 [Acer saccharum]